MSDNLTPRRLRWMLRNKREIRYAFRLPFFPGQPSAGGIIPGRNVQDEFPYAVNLGQRLRSGHSSIHILQQLKQRRAVPGIALEGAAKLIGDQSGFGVWGGHNPLPSPSERVRVNRF